MNLPIKKQVCSLEYAQKLKELGVKQESLYWHAEEKLTGWNNQDWTWGVFSSLYEGDYEQYRNAVSAFTVAELGKIIAEEMGFNLETYKVDEWNIRINHKGQFIVADTEADARAKALIYLLENHLIKLD